ncbi:hypothetical protein AB0M02_12055 [Actinoplanes sp. NPDC051861]|uniref:hypothetical protein n=1 Tax=Actinoplanes sp. NPDC051861 TaxID=3155170 RepID=UPI00342D5E8A
MIALTRITRWALRVAARRWPAAVRDEMLREWHAELADLQSRPGTSGRQAGYAFSLLTSPPVRDGSGVPRGWGGTRPSAGFGPAAALVAAAMLGAVIWQVTRQIGFIGFGWSGALVQGIVLTLWGVPVAWWLGRRLPMSREGRFGRATPAVLAPLAVMPAVLAMSGIDVDIIPVIAVLAWTAGTAILGRAVVRARRAAAVVLTIVGVPTVAVSATALSTLPIVFSWPEGLGAGLRAAYLSITIQTDALVMPDGVLSFPFVGGSLGLLVAYGWLPIVYGRSAAGAARRPARVPASVPAPPAGLPVAALVAGVAAVAGGVVAWAYTVAVLTPGLPVWSADAPMPGGDGEIYLWAAELRWGAILLAALGMTAATANRRSALRPAVLLGAGLLTVEAVLLRFEVSGAAGMRIALLSALVVIGFSWVGAGRVQAIPTRRRVMVVAVGASACGPLLFFQSTPAENHAFMPLGLPLTTALVAVGGVLLGTVTAVAVRRPRLHRAAAVALIGIPVAVAAGVAPYLGNGEGETAPALAGTAALSLGVVVAAVVRQHRVRRRGRTVALWGALAVAAVPGAVAVLYLGIFVLMVVPSMLFLVDGTGYPADGISVLPGAAVLVLPAAMLTAYREGGSAVAVPDGPGELPDLSGRLAPRNVTEPA